MSRLAQLPGAVLADGAGLGAVAHFGAPLSEQRALASGLALVDCGNVDLVAVDGPDRLSWLNSLTSQLLTDLPAGQGTETLLLDPAGHIEDAIGVMDDGGRSWLFVTGGRGQILTAWLDSMRFMLRVQVSNLTDAYTIVGHRPGQGGASSPDERRTDSLLAGVPGAIRWRDPWPRTAAGGTRYGPPDADHPGADWNFELVALPREHASGVLDEAWAAGMRPAGSWAADALRIAAWRPSRAQEVDDRTLPHELDWLRTAVHLDKGCYRGQETVAKVHNLGRPPRRLVSLHLDGSEGQLPALGAEICADGRPVGRLTSVAQHWQDGPIGLGLIRRAADTGHLTVGEIAALATDIVNPDGVAVTRPQITRPGGPR